MLADPVPWRGKTRRAFLALMLTLFSGVVTAAYAVYALDVGWTEYARCNTAASGTTCPSATFWGLPSEWFLVAGVVGIVTGVLTALVGWELHRRAFGLTRGSYAIAAFVLAGLIAYGGFGVGVATGVAGALLFASMRPRRSGAPAEWSGVLPVGVAPVKTAPRPISEKPAVSEWDGVSMPASPQAGSPTNLPSADRLAAALARSKSTGRTSAATRPTAVVLLPPPPTGLANDPPPSSGESPHPVHSPAAAGSEESHRRAPTPPARPAHPTGGSASPQSEGLPPRHTPGGAVAGPLRPAPPVVPSPQTDHPKGGPRSTSTAPPAPVRTAASPPPSPSPARPPQPAPSGAAPAATGSSRVSREALEGHGPGGVRPSAGRSRAWSCPKCRLMNAPWSDHCTRCRTPAPPHGMGPARS